jgi:hypothetical protein
MDKKLYDVLKWVALILLPGLGSLYFGLGQIWGFPAIEQVVGSLVVIDTFLGLVLKQSSANYENTHNFGNLVFVQDQWGTVIDQRLETNKENPIFPVGEKVFYEVKREGVHSSE